MRLLGWAGAGRRCAKHDYARKSMQDTQGIRWLTGLMAACMRVHSIKHFTGAVPGVVGMGSLLLCSIVERLA